MVSVISLMYELCALPPGIGAGIAPGIIIESMETERTHSNARI